MKKILMLSQTVFPPDIRLEKEIKTLSEHGYKIILLCNQYEKGKSVQFKYCKVIRVKALFKKIKFNKILNFPLFLNPRYFYYIIKTFINEKPNFLHAHDLPMVPFALILKLVFSKPVIYDMHEIYPEALRQFKKSGVVNFIIKNPNVADLLEKINLKFSDKIISVVEENKIRLINLGIPKRKIHVVSNTVDLDTFECHSLNGTILDTFKEKRIILYTGTVSPERGLETPVLGMQYLNNDFDDLILVIIGDGIAKKDLQDIVKKHKLADKVLFVPWCGHERLGELIQHAEVCVIPQPSNEFIDNTIPHKLFEYMSCKKTVLLSDAKPFIRIVEETGCGVNFKSNSPVDFAKKVKVLLDSNFNYGLNGRVAVERKYNWNHDALELIKLYESL